LLADPLVRFGIDGCGDTVSDVGFERITVRS
jgi:hypothetical protein